MSTRAPIRTVLSQRATLIEAALALCAALAVWRLAVTFDAFERFFAFSRAHDAWQLDKIFVLGLSLGLAFLLLLARRAADLRREIARRIRAEHTAEALARHDALTGLPNRRVFAEEVKAAMARAAHGDTHCVVLLIDLDRFKPVNELYGHAAGDAVLVEIARRLSETAKEHTSVRIGSDEFAVILECDAAAEVPMRQAQRLITELTRPIAIDGASVTIGASIGIAVYPSDGQTPDELLRAADIALIRAKREGRGTFRFFEASMDEELRSRAELAADLRRALKAGEIVPYYQPLVHLRSNALVGFEVLARWHHPEKGLLPPAAFIPLAEDTGLIGELTDALMSRACADAKALPADIRLAVNVAPAQLRDHAFPQRVLATLTATGFAPGRLEIEITEQALITDLAAVRSVLTSLQAVGVSVALDDFGTGYSSLAHLRELPFDKIKIDRSFVQSLDTAESTKIVQGVVGLCHSLGLPTTAEGIEDAATLKRMSALGCEYGQGYLFGPALPLAEAAALANGKGREAGQHAAVITEPRGLALRTA